MAEGDVVGRVEDDGDDVALADAHEDLELVTVAGQDFCLEHLRRKMLRVGGKVAHEVLEIGGFGSGDEGGPAPMVNKRPA